MTVLSDMVMDGYYAKNRLEEIWEQITLLHLSYLEMEESPQKLEQRNKLDEFIKEFLCLTPHNRKFVFRETAEVLHRSASTKKDFSGYKAALGWNAIGTYAANLLSQPWRKEYRQIKKYSGFYKHEIEANLVGAEIMFEAMGYKHDGNDVLIFDGPVCPDRVIGVSQDSLVAYVECQILKAIWEEVSTSFKISWLEVLEFRETHLCSPKQSVQALTYRYHERQYQQHSRSYSQVPPPDHLCPPIPTAQLIEVEHQNPTYDVPDGPSHSRTSRVYGTGQRQPVIEYQNLKSEVKNVSKNGDKEDATQDSAENWDYVYRNLEIQGYSKDLGERGDVLSPPLDTKKARPGIKEAKTVKSTALDDAIYNMSLNNRTPKISEALQKFKEHEMPPIDPKTTIDNEIKISDNGSSYDNLSSQDANGKKTGKVVLNGVNRTKTITHEKNIFAADSSPSGKLATSKTLDPRKPKLSDKTKSKDVRNTITDLRTTDGPTVNKWQCIFCTYLNEALKEICEMCGKSKTVVPETLEVGGSQCPQCTLVNKKDIKDCEACGTSLKDSPTYI